MEHQELISYISKALAAGYGRAEIEEALKKQGWQDTAIEAAFTMAPHPPQTPTANETPQNTNSPAGMPPAATEGKLPGTFTLLATAWHTYTKRFGTLIGLTILPIVALIGVGLLAALFFGLNAISSPTTPSSLFASPVIIILSVIFILLLTLLILLVSSWMQVALVYAVRGDGFKEALKKSWRNLTGYYWVVLLGTILLLGAYGFFFIPAIIAGVWFMFAGFVYVVEGKHGSMALWQSKALTKGYWWAIFGRWLLFSIVTFLPLYVLMVIFSNFKPVSIILQIILFLLTPLTIAYTNALYDALAKRPVTAKPSKSFIAIAVIGLLFTVTAIGLAITSVHSLPELPPSSSAGYL